VTPGQNYSGAVQIGNRLSTSEDSDMARRTSSGSMTADIEVGGHYVATKAPSLSKGEFQQVGTFMDDGDMTSIVPRGISVNSKTDRTQIDETP
jgi:hypothetical protein